MPPPWRQYWRQWPSLNERPWPPQMSSETTCSVLPPMCRPLWQCAQHPSSARGSATHRVPWNRVRWQREKHGARSHAPDAYKGKALYHCAIHGGSPPTTQAPSAVTRRESTARYDYRSTESPPHATVPSQPDPPALGAIPRHETPRAHEP